MELGTATLDRLPNGWWIVKWLNTGSFLRNEPRRFATLAEAAEFCRSRNLTIIQ